MAVGEKVGYWENQSDMTYLVQQKPTPQRHLRLSCQTGLP